MMLVKEICQKCYNEHRSTPWAEHRKRDKKTGQMYSQKDRTWNRGKMYCVALMDTRERSVQRCQISVDGPPPKCCFYLVAQVMKAAEIEKFQNSEQIMQ